MKDLTEAELIEIESRAQSLVDTLEPDPEQMRTVALIEAFNQAFNQAEDISADIATLSERLRAVSIEAQKMENLAAKDAA